MTDEALKQAGKVILELFEKHLEDQIVTAVEGGINYWGGIDKISKWKIPPDSKKRGEVKDDEFISMYIVRILNEGGAVKFFDAEDQDDDSEWYLTKEKLFDGFIKMQKEYPFHYSDIVEESGDATTADVFVQMGLFGEIVYG